MYRPASVTTEPDPASAALTAQAGPHVCTIVSSWAATTRLIETLHAHHPDWTVTVLAPGSSIPADEQTALPDTCELTNLDDLGLSENERIDLPLIYESIELVGALVPHLLRQMLILHPDGVLYLSDDIEVHGSLDIVTAALATASIVLSPAMTSVEPDDDLEPTTRRLLVTGRFTLGAAGVRAGAEPFLDWWARACRWDAVHDPAQGLWGAGRWLDLAPSLFEVAELRHPGVVLDPQHLRDRAPDDLRLLSFRGLDPARPHLLDPELRRPRHLLSEDPPLLALATSRAEALGRGLSPAAPVDPVPLDLLVRRMALGALREARAARRPPPFAVSAESWADLARWLSEPVARPGAPVTRLLHAVWASRTDLRLTFPDPLGDSGAPLVAWARQDADFQRDYRHLQVEPQPRGAPTDGATAAVPGFDIVGYLDAELGLGEVARLLTRAVERAGIPCRALTFRETRSRQEERFRPASGSDPHSATLLCVNADQTPLASACLPGVLDKGRHRIGYWFWEVDQFPAEQRQALHFVDELWVASAYVASVFRAVTDKPVTVIPQPVAPVTPTTLVRADLGLTDRFTFAFWFDAFSSTERKNPVAVVRAFCEAFRPNEGPVLLIKSINGDADRRAMEELRAATRGRPDVQLVDAYWSGIEMRALVQLIDCYVSLHRAEGFGQTMAEAMMAGRPVIATAHSGNLQFMHDENSFLVPHELVVVGTGTPYPATACWAEPDVHEAARLMRHVITDDEHRRDVSRRAAVDIERTNGFATSAGWLQDRFQQLVSDPAR